jgi:hypothetical protein
MISLWVSTNAARGAVMTYDPRAAYRADDARLLTLVRAGDTAAYQVLCQRHEQAARRLASLLAPADEAGRLVAEAFAEVRDVTLLGGGPADAFRPCLLSELRRISHDGPDGAGSPEPRQWLDSGQPVTGLATADAAAALMAAAFGSLPERSIAVLWHTDIEETSPAETAQILGLSASGVAALRRRARNALRQVYLQLHFSGAAGPECQPIARRLAELVCDTASRRDTAIVTEHLGHCRDCRAVYTQLTDINIALRTQVAPVYLGSAAAAYLSATHRRAAGDAAATGLAVPAMAEEPGAPEAASLATPDLSLGQTRPGREPGRRRPSRPVRWLVAGAAGVAVAVTAVALTVAAQGTSPPPSLHRQQVQAAGVPTSASPTDKPQTTAPGSSTTASQQPASSGPPTPAPSAGSTTANDGGVPTQAPITQAAQLSATVGVGFWHRQEDLVTFAVTDTGNAATGELTASLTLPGGSYVDQVQGETGGWTCQPSRAGASCQHNAIAAGSQTPQSAIGISTENGGCHQVVEMTAVSGNASASATSGQIPC